MSSTAQLNIRFLDYWHCGTGKGAGAHLDAVVDLDRYGLPFVPGKHIRGLLRDAVERLESWGQLAQFAQCPTQESLAVALFGSAGGMQTLREPGRLEIRNATLPPAFAEWLCGEPGRSAPLFRELHSAAIDPESGVARSRFLRGIQVTVPLELQAELACADSAGIDWKAVITSALALVPALGAHRSRGLGRAVLKLA